MTIIPITQHPNCADPKAALVSSIRERFSVYRVEGGYVATTGDGFALAGVYATEDAARTALNEALAAS